MWSFEEKIAFSVEKNHRYVTLITISYIDLPYIINFLWGFQGLDPALPLIKESERLSYRDAERVHTISTNAGVYGDIGSIGHVDVCVNNGNVQPFCVDERSNL